MDDSFKDESRYRETIKSMNEMVKNTPQKNIPIFSHFFFPSFQLDRQQTWNTISIPSDPLVCSQKLKSQIRRGVPDAKRRKLWKVLTHAQKINASEIEGIYKDRLKEVFGSKIPKKIQKIPTFAGEVHFENFFLRKEAEEVAKRILCVLAMEHPEMSFCPLIPDLVHIFLHFYPEDETFMNVNQMIKRSKSTSWYFPTTKKGKRGVFVRIFFDFAVGWRIFEYTFDDLVEKLFPKVWKRICQLEMQSCIHFTDGWFKRIFISWLPFQVVLRVMDAYLNEGSKVERMSLAILIFL